MDNLTRKQRSKTMSRVRSKGSRIEVLFRTVLKQVGLKFRQNIPTLLGKPDFAIRNKKAVVFIDSCFWHGCRYHCRLPHSNRRYWNSKIQRNKDRDKVVNKWYKKNDYKILRVWEHEILPKPTTKLELKIKGLK